MSTLNANAKEFVPMIAINTTTASTVETILDVNCSNIDTSSNSNNDIISNKILVPFVNTCFRVGGYWNALVQLVDDEEIYYDNLINDKNYVRTTGKNNNSILTQEEINNNYLETINKQCNELPTFEKGVQLNLLLILILCGLLACAFPNFKVFKFKRINSKYYSTCLH